MHQLKSIPENAPAIVVDSSVMLAAMGVHLGQKASAEMQRNAEAVLRYAFNALQLVSSMRLRDDLIFKGTNPALKPLASFNQLAFVSAVCRQQKLVKLGPEYKACVEEMDNRAVETAVGGKARYLVTLGANLQSRRKVGDVEIMSPSRFLEAMRHAEATARRKAGKAEKRAVGNAPRNAERDTRISERELRNAQRDARNAEVIAMLPAKPVAKVPVLLRA